MSCSGSCVCWCLNFCLLLSGVHLPKGRWWGSSVLFLARLPLNHKGLTEPRAQGAVLRDTGAPQTQQNTPGTNEILP